MSKYLLSMVEDKKKVISISKSFSYSFDVKKKFEKIDVSSITIYDKEMMNNYASHVLEKRFKKLVSIVKQIIEEEGDSEESFDRCLDMISKYEDILFNEYKEYLKRKNYQEFIDKVTLLRDYIETQIIAFNEKSIYNVKGGR